MLSGAFVGRIPSLKLHFGRLRNGLCMQTSASNYVDSCGCKNHNSDEMHIAECVILFRPMQKKWRPPTRARKLLWQKDINKVISSNIF